MRVFAKYGRSNLGHCDIAATFVVGPMTTGGTPAPIIARLDSEFGFANPRRFCQAGHRNLSYERGNPEISAMEGARFGNLLKRSAVVQLPQ